MQINRLQNDLMETGRALRDAQKRVHDHDLTFHTLNEDCARGDKALEAADQVIHAQMSEIERLTSERDEFHALARSYKEEVDSMKRQLTAFSSKV